MTEIPLPEDFSAEPLGIWHPNDGTNIWWKLGSPAWNWAREHIRDSMRTWKCEFYLVDVPFAVCYRMDFTGMNAAEVPPVIQLLDELPPAWMLSEEEFARREVLRLMHA